MNDTQQTSSNGAKGAIVVACLALFTDMLVYGLAIPVLPLLDATMAAGPMATGTLFASYAVTLIISTPIAGRLVDRHGPRMPLLIGLVGLTSATLLFSLGGPFWLLMIARSLQGLAAGASWVAGLALIATVTPMSQRGQTMGVAMSMIAIGTLVGPPMSGVIAHHFGLKAPFFAAAVLAMLDGILRLVFVKPLPPVTDDPVGPLTVLRVPGSAAVTGLVALSGATFSSIEPVLPRYLADQFHLDPWGIGWAFALMVLVVAILSPIVGSRMGVVSARRLVLIGIGIAALGMVAVGFSTHLWHVLAGLILLGIAVSCFSAPASVLIGIQGMQTSPPALGGAYSLYNLAYALGLMAGPLVSGTLFQALDTSFAFIALAVCMATVGPAVLFRLPTALASHPYDAKLEQPRP